MHIDTIWKTEDQFNVHLASKEGAEPFLEIKGCRVANSAKGPFVSWPATKNANGKWWQHCYASEKFAAVVLSKAQETKPRAERARGNAAGPVDDSDIPPF